MKLIEDILKKYDRYEELTDDIKGGIPVSISGLIDPSKAFLAQLLKHEGPNLFLTYDEKRGRQFCDMLETLGVKALYYPAKDIIFYNANIHGDAVAIQRMKVISMLLENRDCVIVTTAASLLDRLQPPTEIKKRMIRIDKSSVIKHDKIAKELVSCGYIRQTEIERPGDFSVRGNIIDVFPFTMDMPVRIELWDENIDSIRLFDLSSQRTVKNIDEVVIYPAKEYTGVDMDDLSEALNAELKENFNTYYANGEIERAMRLKKVITELINDIRFASNGVPLEGLVSYFVKESCCFLDYFPKEARIMTDEPTRVKENLDNTFSEYRISMTDRLALGYVLPGQTKAVYSSDEITARLSRLPGIELTLIDNKSLFDERVEFHMDTKVPSSYDGNLDLLCEDLKDYLKNGYEITILTENEIKGQRLKTELTDRDIFSVNIVQSRVKKGSIFPKLKCVLMTYGDIAGRYSHNTRQSVRQKNVKTQAVDYNELSNGDYVVHVNYGIGIYRGLEKIEVDGGYKDYLKIEYKDKAKLYVPATSLHMLSKYSSKSEAPPKINGLGDAAWKKAKAKVKAACEETAAYLISLYADRLNTKGYRYSEDTLWQKEFEELFPYEETDDQLRAIADIKKDMESDRIMDRLLCGDVGFGKTEVAIRAAFKAVNDSKQVAYLVPTTILASQHFTTFSNRMKLFGINVGLLSRLVSKKEQTRVLKELAEGRIDVVIGTHRLLSKDVAYKDLGLLIIDEEQRFGVSHKEKIKQLRKDVDVLTLTATPIPRTLHMSLSGIRDMSVLTQAPVDRLPIQTFVIEYDDQMIREAINRELMRNGQVYYVYNRINNIEDVVRKLREMLPEARIAFAHGQMSVSTLDEIMTDFIDGEIDVLVSTTIIETGLDIPNVNTIIIHDAQNYGLAQLYQLRGRVGRSNRTAYAFLTYTKDRIVGEQAQKRLHAIREFTDLGSGFKIAMKDLEIRGAGSVLGETQHGHMALVGYDMYVRMLNRAVRSLSGEKDVKDYETSIDLDIDAYIPDDYISNELSKLDIYKRIAAISDEEEYMDMIDELNDRFGEIPESAMTLLKIALIKNKAHDCFITDIKGGADFIRFAVYEGNDYDPSLIAGLVKKYKGRLTYTGAGVQSFVYRTLKKGELGKKEVFLSTIGEILDDIKTISKEKKGEAG